MAPKTTILTTFRNAAPFLATSIGSLKAQRQADFRAILVDDGSDDDWRSVVEPLIERDDRFEVLVEPPRGRRAALELAHARAETEFVAWLDADDWLHPDALLRTEAFLGKHPEVGMVFTDSVRVDSTGQRVPQRHRAAWSRSRQLVEFATFHFRLIRRAAFRAAGGLSDLEIGIDYDLALRLAEVTRFAHLAEPLYHYRQHAAQMSSRKKDAQMHASARAVCRAIARRGTPATTFRLRRGRFTLRVELPGAAPTRRGRMKKAWEVARARARPRPQTATVWPGTRQDFVATSIRDGLHRCGLALTGAGESLAQLQEAARAGRLGELLVLHRLGPLLQRGGEPRLVEVAVLLARVRARGVRVVWCRWSDRCDAAVSRAATWVLKASVDLVVERPGRSATAAGHVGALGPPDASEFVPHRTRGFARRCLGLPAGGPVLLCAIDETDGAQVAREVRALEAKPTCLLVAQEGRGTSRAWATMVAAPRTSRCMATLVAACDGVILGAGPQACEVSRAAVSAQKPVLRTASAGCECAGPTPVLSAGALAVALRGAGGATRGCGPDPLEWAEALLAELGHAPAPRASTLGHRDAARS